MPSASIRFGSHLATSVVLAGGDYKYDDWRAWINPIENLWDRPLPSFDETHPVVKGLEKCIEFVAKTVGDKGFINPPVLLEGLTFFHCLEPQRNSVSTFMKTLIK